MMTTRLTPRHTELAGIAVDAAANSCQFGATLTGRGVDPLAREYLQTQDALANDLPDLLAKVDRLLADARVDSGLASDERRSWSLNRTAVRKRIAVALGRP